MARSVCVPICSVHYDVAVNMSNSCRWLPSPRTVIVNANSLLKHSAGLRMELRSGAPQIVLLWIIQSHGKPDIYERMNICPDLPDLIVYFFVCHACFPLKFDHVP